jgi:dTMP kinase
MSLFITFEGIEGCGKSYQAKILYEKISGMNIPSLLTFEPGGTSFGKEIRRILKKELQYRITPQTELFLFTACRTQLLKEIIFPGLRDKEIIICDRYVDSTIAYQGYGRCVDSEIVDTVILFSTGGLIPDLIILLDLPVEEGLKRKKQKTGDRFDSEDLDFHNRVREGYLKLVNKSPDRWLVVNGLLSKNQISTIVWEKVSPLLPKTAP